MRNAAIHLRALPEQRDLIDRAAALLGKNRSAFILEAACERAQAVVLDNSLDTACFRAKVQEALDDPRPGLPHKQVMDEAQALIDRKRRART